MVGEIVTGAVGGAIGSAAQAVAPAVIEAPLAAVQALPAVVDVPVVAALSVESVSAAVPEIMEAPVVAAQGAANIGGTLGAAPAIANAAAESASAVQEGMSLLSSATELAPNVPSVADTASLVSELHMFVRQGDPAGALEFLAYGKIQGAGSFAEMGADDKASLLSAFVNLQNMLPEHAQTVLNTVEGLQIPDNVRNDPEFLQKFMTALQEGKGADANTQDAQKKSMSLQSFIQSSAQKALEQHAGSKLTHKDLEKLKNHAAKKAAMEAIREHMNHWRISVIKDKRLNERAQRLALRKIDLVEKRLFTQEAMKWDGLSIMKLIALAHAWMQEMKEDTLPQARA